MHIYFAASECVPFSKTGGLADVIGALPPALANLGHQVTVFLPHYRQTNLDNPQRVIPSITVPFDDRYRFCSVLDGGKRSGVQFYFIDYPPFFDRDGLYGTPLGDYHDNAERFAMFSRAVLEASKVLGAPDILHCHDWQTALIPVLLKTLYDEDPAFCNAPCVVYDSQPRIPGTFPAGDPAAAHAAVGPVHDVEAGVLRQGEFPEGRNHYGRLHHHGEPEVCQEIQTSEYGFGLEGVLRGRGNTVAGILNAVDYNSWNPRPISSSPRRMTSGPQRKAESKADLLKNLEWLRDEASGGRHRLALRCAKGLRPDSPGCRPAALEEVIVVALGTGDREYEDMFARLKKQYPTRFCEGRVRQRPGAQDRGRQRYVPDAVSLRALRTEPDLQSEVRHRAGRARDRRTRRYDRALRPGDRQGNRV